MNHIRSSFTLFSFVVAVLTVSSSLAFSQPLRALGAGALVLDDGNGNTITLIPPPGLFGNYNYYLPTSPGGNIMSGYVAAGSALGQILYWNGSYWQPGGTGSVGQVLTLNGSGIPIWAPSGEGGGSFINNSTSLQSSASFNIDGSGQVGTTFNISATNGAYQIGSISILSDVGNNNIFVGKNAGSITTGSFNTFTGGGSGNQNTTGTLNTFIGELAGNANTTGITNTFVGSESGQSNATGHAIVLLGNHADVGSDGLENAIAIGRGAVVNASNTIQLGDGSMTSVNSNGSFNTTGGAYDIGGITVLSISGSSNLFVGDDAGLSNNASDDDNTFVGNRAGQFNTDGTGNTFTGAGSGRNNLGDGNSFFGAIAGFGNTSGNYNTGVGFNAGSLNYFGDSNTFLGYGANAESHNLTNATAIGANAAVTTSNTMQLGDGGVILVNSSGSFNTSGGVYQIGDTTVLSDPGTYNIFVGAQSGLSNTTGLQNTFVGAAAGASNTTAGGNTFVGAGAGSLTTTGGANTFVGDNAGNANTAGGNTFVGAGAGEVNTTGEYNTFFGLQTGLANTTGDSNSFVGTAAGQANTTGSLNTFEGFEAGVANTNGVGNTFVGVEAGGANTTASSNTFVGEGSGILNTTGGANTFLGAEAGNANTTAGGNTFVGGAAGITNTTGEYNAMFGFQAGYYNTTGDSNTFVGTAAGQSNGTGSLNTFAGFLAGRFNTTGIGNTFIGDESGLSNSSENNNTFIGYTSTGAVGIMNAMAIGAGSIVSTSNTIQLGNDSVTSVNSNGSFNTTAGGFQTNGTTRIDANGSATLDSLTASSVVTFTGLVAGTPTSYLALDASNNVILASGGGGGGISGSGTAGRIPIWTDATTQGNSHLADNGTTLSYLGSDINTGSDYKINNTTVLSTYTIDGADELFLGHGAGGSDDLTDATAIGANAIVQADFTIQLGDANVTSINTYGALTAAGLTINNATGNNDVTGSSWSVDNGGNGIFNTLALNNAGNSNDITGTNYNWYADNTGFLLAGNGIESDNGLDVYGDGIYVDQNGIDVNGGIEVASNDIEVDQGDVYIDDGMLSVGNGSVEIDNDGTTTISEQGSNDALTISGGEGNDITGTNDNWQVDGGGNATFGNMTINQQPGSDALTINGGEGNDITGTNSNWYADNTGFIDASNGMEADNGLDVYGNGIYVDQNGIGVNGGIEVESNDMEIDQGNAEIDNGDLYVGNGFTVANDATTTISELTNGNDALTIIGSGAGNDIVGTGESWEVNGTGDGTYNTITTTGTVNATGGAIQTNSITRIDNAGTFMIGGKLFASTESDASGGDQVTVSGNTVFAEATGSGSGPCAVIVTNASPGQMLYLYDNVSGMTLTLNGSTVAYGKVGIFVFYGGNWIGTN